MVDHAQNVPLNSLGSDHEKLRIAVIDDEQNWLKVFQRMFRNSAYRVDAYSDPQHFLRIIRQHPDRYAGIICDIKIPQMNGYQIFQALKENKATCNIPFLLVSGALTEDHNIYKVQGMAYVSKLDENLCSKVHEELIEAIARVKKQCNRYIANLYNTSMDTISE